MTNKAFIKIRKKLISKRIIDENGCWLYQGSRREDYGEIYSEGRTIRAHRASMIVFRNHPELLDHPEIYVCHKCDVKSCVNPEHLYLGTWVENNMDSALRNPEVGKEFSIQAARIFADKHKVRYWKALKNIEKYYKK